MESCSICPSVTDISLRIISSISIDAVPNDRIIFLLKDKQHSIVCIYHIFLIYSPINRPLFPHSLLL